MTLSSLAGYNSAKRDWSANESSSQYAMDCVVILHRLAVSGYRSIGRVEIFPTPLTIFVGANNTGKSNIVDALAFVASSSAVGPTFAVAQRGGFDNVIRRSLREPNSIMSFELEADASRQEVERLSFLPPIDEALDSRLFDVHGIRFAHSFTINGSGEPLVSDVSIGSERLRIDLSTSNGLRRLLEVFRDSTSGIVLETDDRTTLDAMLPIPYDMAEDLLRNSISRDSIYQNLLPQMVGTFLPVAFGFARFAFNTRVFQLAPNECRIPAPPASGGFLGTHGENLPSQVHFLRQNSPAAWHKVMAYMSLIVPDLVDVTVVPTLDRQWTLNFREVDDSVWSASEVSDGTIRSLALLVAIFDHRNSITVIEEPENSLHPWALRVLIKACHEATELGSKQILITTHSPVLIDFVDPRELVVVWKDLEGTLAAPLTLLLPSAISDWENGGYTLSELLDSGFLPKSVPATGVPA